MTRLAIVGSRCLEGSEEARRLVREAIERHRATVVVSGGARGVDTMAREEAQKLGIEVKEWLPLRPAQSRDMRVAWAREYRARDRQIAADCACLVLIESKTTRTHGARYTHDRARALGKPTEEFLV